MMKGIRNWFKSLSVREAVGGYIDPDEHLYRRLTGNRSSRDLTPLAQDKMIEVSAYMWESNLIANRMIELPLSFILGEGLRMTVNNEEHQQVLDRFWRINELDIKLRSKMRELALFGEQVWPVFVNEISGQVRLGYVPPKVIYSIECDPQNMEQPIGVITKKDLEGNYRQYRIIVNGADEEILSQEAIEKRATYTDGDAFFFRINHLVSGTRGRSDLLAQNDWLDAYENYLYGEMERTTYLSSFVWDVMLQGASEDQVRAKQSQITAPEPGSVRIHNESEQWNAVSPSLQAGETAEAARLFRNHSLGGATLPEHWFGGGGDVNRATGESMSEPTVKMLTARQKELKYILNSVGFYVLRQYAMARGMAEPDVEDPDYIVNTLFPDLTSRDISRYAGSLQQVVAASAIAIDRGLITQHTGVQLIQSIAGRLGVEFEADKELEAAMEQSAQANRMEMEQDMMAGPVPDDEAA